MLRGFLSRIKRQTYAWRRGIRLIFGFSRKEMNGFALLLPLMLMIILLPSLYNRYSMQATKRDFSKESRTLDSLLEAWQDKKARDESRAVALSIPTHPIDPNTATIQELENFGFPAHLATRIVHYREKGGKFPTKQSLLKIYHMDTALFIRLQEYIVVKPLPTKKRKFREPAKKDTIRSPSIFNRRVTAEITQIDINQADTSKLRLIRGIGSVLSSRIVDFRGKLGGFVQLEQLKEVYGLDSTVRNRLLQVAVVDSLFSPQKININTATVKDLSNHPYISWTIAKAIVAYRFQHGTFVQIEDIRNILLVDQNIFSKIEPYLTVH